VIWAPVSARLESRTEDPIATAVAAFVITAAAFAGPVTAEGRVFRLLARKQ
jgi:hypothetical protein